MFSRRQAFCCSVCQLCLTIWNPMDCSTPGFTFLHHLLEFAQIHVNWVGDAIQPSLPLSAPFLPAFNLSKSFPMSQLFTSGGQSIGVSALASVLPINIQGWFPLGLTGLISLLSKDSQESSPMPQFKSINSLVFNLLYGPTFTSIYDYWKKL